jgi:hypothetical protein
MLRSSELRLAWGVFVFVLVFFSFSATKLPHYGFYGLSGLVVIVSLWLAAGPLNKSAALRALMLLTLVASALLVTSTPLWFGATKWAVSDPYYQAVLTDAGIRLQSKELLLAALAFAGVAGFVIGFGRFRSGVAILTLTTAVATYGVIVPIIMQSLRDPIVQIGQFIRNQTSREITVQPNRIITWRLTAPSLSFSARRIIPSEWPRTGDWVVLHEKHLIELVQQPGCRNPKPLTRGIGLAMVICQTGVSDE